MARATAHPDRQCISSEDIQGTEVYGAGGKNIGEIDHLIIDKVSGRVAYAVMSFGGFVGLGHSHYPIPWGALTYDTSLGGFRTNITEQQLKDAPEFSDNSWQDRGLGNTHPPVLRDTHVLGVARWPNTLDSASALRLEPANQKARSKPGSRHERLSGFKLVERSVLLV